jgi:hypothetical protein
MILPKCCTEAKDGATTTMAEAGEACDNNERCHA